MKTKSKVNSSLNFVKIIRGVLLAYFITIILFLVLALVMYFTSISENIIPKAVVGISALSIFLSGIYATRDIGHMGWLHGGLIGFLYMGILIVLSSLIAPSFAFSLNVAIDVFISFLVGVVAGIIGVSL